MVQNPALRHSLDTSNLDQPIKLRDTYLRPVIASLTVEELLKQLEHYIEFRAGHRNPASASSKLLWADGKAQERTLSLKEVCEHS